MIIVDHHTRTPPGMTRLVELAKNAAMHKIINNIGRMNFPSRHPLEHVIPFAPSLGRLMS